MVETESVDQNRTSFFGSLTVPQPGEALIFKVVRALLPRAHKGFIAALSSRAETLNRDSIQCELWQCNLKNREEALRTTTEQQRALLISERDELNQRVARERSALDRTHAHVTLLRQERDRLTSDIESLTGVFRSTEQRLGTLLETETRINARLCALRAELQLLHDALDEARSTIRHKDEIDAACVNLNAKKEVLRADIVRLNKEKDTISTRVQILEGRESDLLALERARTTLADEVKRIRAALATSDINGLSTEIASIYRMLQEIRGGIGTNKGWSLAERIGSLSKQCYRR